MSQHDMDLANAAGASFRADLNLALVALVGQNSGAAAPATTFAYQFWADTTTGWLKQRNAANSAWIYVQPLAGHAEAALASATTTDLGAQVSDAVLISGTTTITGFGTADAGRIVKVRHSGALTLTHNGTSLILPGAANITTAAGDTYDAESLGSGNWVVRAYQKASGLPIIGGGAQIQPISASVGSSALTISASALSLDFRSATLTSGAVTTVSGTPSNLVISSGSTLGTVSAQQSRIAVLALNNAGTIELAAVNISGGTSLTETGVISTTAEGGAGAADSATVVYSTTARTNVAYRVIGYIESTQATAGTWATAPSTIQGAGGQALNDMGSIGYGQTWSSVIGSRALGTTYYNTTGKPILAVIAASVGAGSAGLTVTINGTAVVVGLAVVSAAYGQATVIIPPNASYSASMTGGTLQVWAELR